MLLNLQVKTSLSDALIHKSPPGTPQSVPGDIFNHVKNFLGYTNHGKPAEETIKAGTDPTGLR